MGAYEEWLASGLLKDDIAALMMNLSKREIKVISLRFGLGLTETAGVRTLEETAKYFNVCRERIRQIEAKALRKMRQVKAAAKTADLREVMEEELNRGDTGKATKCLGADQNDHFQGVGSWDDVVRVIEDKRG